MIEVQKDRERGRASTQTIHLALNRHFATQIVGPHRNRPASEGDHLDDQVVSARTLLSSESFIQTFDYRFDQNELVEMFLFGLIVISGHLSLFMPCFRPKRRAVYAEDRQMLYRIWLKHMQCVKDTVGKFKSSIPLLN